MNRRSRGNQLLHSFAALAVGLVLMPASALAQVTPDLKALLDDLVAANRILYRQGVVDGFGHVSVRHPARPDRFLMSAAKAPGRVNGQEIERDCVCVNRRSAIQPTERTVSEK